jgi:glycosyl transferase, family 25
MFILLIFIVTAVFLRKIFFRKSVVIFLCTITAFVGFFGFCLKETEPENPLFQGMGVYVINLDRSPHRFEHMQKIFQPTGFQIERIKAVDGNQLTEKQIRVLVDQDFYAHFLKGFHLGKGAIGCSLSHIKTWKKFLQSKHAFALICEDDISFDPQELKNVLKKLMIRTEMFDLCTLELLERRSGAPLKIAALGDHNLVLYFKTIMDSGCYLINRKAAAHLLEKALPIKMPLDVYFTRAWELDIKFTGIEPRIVHQVERTSTGLIIASDINMRGRDNSTQPCSIPLLIQKNLYSFAGAIMRVLYNLNLYIHFNLKKIGNLHL